MGQADSTLITINGYTMLIDSGNASDGYYIVEFLDKINPKYAIISVRNR